MTTRQRCAHKEAVPVESGGKTVAALCPGCDERLPVAWLTCAHENTVAIPEMGDRPPYREICCDCGGIFWPTEDA